MSPGIITPPSMWLLSWYIQRLDRKKYNSWHLAMCHGISNHISYHTLVTCPVTYLWRIYHLIRVYCWEEPDLCWANGMLVSTSVDTPPPTAKKSSSRAWNKNIDILQKTTPEFRAERLLLIKLSLDITPLRWTQTRSCRSIRSLHLNRDWTRYPFWNWTQYPQLNATRNPWTAQSRVPSLTKPTLPWQQNLVSVPNTFRKFQIHLNIQLHL